MNPYAINAQSLVKIVLLAIFTEFNALHVVKDKHYTKANAFNVRNIALNVAQTAKFA